MAEFSGTASFVEPSKTKFYNVYEASTAIDYSPEQALKEGLGMVKSIKSSLKKLSLGSKLRQDVWLREIET